MFPHREATNLVTDPPFSEFKCPRQCREKEDKTHFIKLEELCSFIFLVLLSSGIITCFLLNGLGMAAARGEGWHWAAGRLRLWVATTASGTRCCGYCMCWQWVRALVMWSPTSGSFLLFILPNPFLCHWADSTAVKCVFRRGDTKMLCVNILLCYCKLSSWGLDTSSSCLTTLILSLPNPNPIFPSNFREKGSLNVKWQSGCFETDRLLV